MSKNAADGRPGTGRHMLRGSVWMIALRWAMRLTGVVSTVVLARLLKPEDFGVVAIAMILVGMFEMLAETGQSNAIIRHVTPTREHYDTAWTISILVGLGIAIAIVAVAPLSSIYFHEPRSIIVMQCLAVRSVLNGLVNVGTVDFRRDLRFDRVFRYNFYAKIFSFAITIVLAVLLRNYWALVAGIIAGQLALTVLSYIMHSYRPRISFTKMSEIWSFSIWTLIRSIGTYFFTQVDNMAIGGIAGATPMGRYTVAKDVASSPTEELVSPMTSVLFPIMAKFQHDLGELRRLYLRTLGWSAIIGASTGIGVALVASDMVRLVLGIQWISVIPLMGWLALTMSLATLQYGAYTILDVIGMPHIGAKLQWYRVLAAAMLIFPVAYLTRDLVTIAIARFMAECVITPSLLFVVRRHTGITLRDYGMALWRPLSAGAAMALVVWSTNRLLTFTGPPRLALDIILGAISYLGALMSLWRVSGRPLSAESDLHTVIMHLFATLGIIRARGLGAAQ